jgi:hypothetical protein
MLTSEYPSLSPSILGQYSASETSYRSYQEMSYAQQCDMRALECNERYPDMTSLLFYDRKPNDVITVLIDIVIEIFLRSATQNDETVYSIESNGHDFMNHTRSDTTHILVWEPRLPINSNI